MRYPVRQRRVSKRSTVNTLNRIRSHDEPRSREALNETEAVEWRKAMENKFQTLKEMKFCAKTGRPNDQRVLHGKFVLKGKRDCNGNIDK